MSFISVLFALLLEQARPLGPGNPIHAGMRAWVRWCARNFDTNRPQHVWLAWSLAVGLPSVLALLVYWLLLTLAVWPLAMLWSALVLYASLGFRQFSFHFTQIRDALAQGDETLARALLASWQQIDTQELQHGHLIGRVIEASVLASHRHVFGVLAWFSVLAAFGFGPTGAVLYRLGEFVARYWQFKSLSQQQPVSETLQKSAYLAWTLIDWLPARITALGFAVVGNFEEAIDGWRQDAAQSESNNDSLMLAATAGAVNLQLKRATSNPDATQRPTPELAHLAIVVGLVWRAVVLWVFLLALLTLARLLG
jgi:adenosylcobinamide-phosphate synthase